MHPLDRVVHAAQHDAVAFLPRVEPHWAGMAIGLLGVALGVSAARAPALMHGPAPWGWVGMGLALVGMALHWVWRRADRGWQVDFAKRQATPVGQAGAVVQLPEAPEGWTLACTAGERRASLAIDLVHPERGRVARLWQSDGALRRDQHRLVSLLADVLARRLHLPRRGVTFSDS